MSRIQNPKTNSQSHAHNQSAEEVSGVQSKCSTPKKYKHYDRQDGPEQDQQSDGKEDSNLKTEYKKSKFFATRKGELVEFEKIMAGKLDNYEIIAGTLREYVKDQQKKCVSRKKYLGTVTSIIKAYAKSQISQISPSVSLLITKILDSLPKKETTRRSLPRIRQKQKQKQRQREETEVDRPNANRKHSRQFSFSHKKERGDKTLQSEIAQLEQNLLDLRKQSRILEEVKQQYEEMEYSDKLEYIAELEEIVRRQKAIIDNINHY